MPILILIVGAIFGALVWYWRLRQAGVAAQEIGSMARDVLGAARALGFRRRANIHPVESVDDVSLAVTAIGVAFLELNDLPSREDQKTLAQSVASNTRSSADKVEEMMIVGRWLVGECNGPQPAISRLTRRLSKLDSKSFQTLLPILNDLGQGAGGLSTKQKESLEEIARLMKLR